MSAYTITMKDLSVRTMYIIDEDASVEAELEKWSDFDQVKSYKAK